MGTGSFGECRHIAAPAIELTREMSRLASAGALARGPDGLAGKQRDPGSIGNKVTNPENGSRLAGGWGRWGRGSGRPGSNS